MRSPIQFPGIARHAEILGVSRPHLWKVLTGKRESVSLTNRYRQLVAQETANQRSTRPRKSKGKILPFPHQA